MKRKVGKVSVTEKDEILSLYERRNGLTELAKIIDVNNQVLYDKLVNDLGSTQVKFQQWWDKMASQYNWETVADGKWEIDFDTCDIYLVIG